MQSDGADIRPLADDSDSDIEQSTENLGQANLQLRVVLDTNILWVDSASDLVRREVATLLKGSIFPDVTILWYLPDVVLHERQYQMQRKALELYPSVTKIERLLGQQLNTTKDAFLKRVETVVVEECHRLGILTLDLDTKRVEWQRLIGKALYRKPPFQEGETEKGFRDSLVAEAFLQLVASPAEPPHLCRTVFVTSDKLLAATVRGELSTPSAAVLSGIGELTGLINTLIANVDERFIARLQAKAAKLFFVSGERKDTLYYQEDLYGRIVKDFESDLNDAPDEVTYRKNGQWWVSEPQFVRKHVGRMFWATRLDVEAKAIKLDIEHWQSSLDPSAFPTGMTTLASLMSGGVAGLPPIKKTVTHKGTDSYEVGWSTEVTITEELENPRIGEIKHIGINWEAIAS